MKELGFAGWAILSTHDRTQLDDRLYAVGFTSGLVFVGNFIQADDMTGALMEDTYDCGQGEECFACSSNFH